MNDARKGGSSFVMTHQAPGPSRSTDSSTCDLAPGTRPSFAVTGPSWAGFVGESLRHRTEERLMSNVKLSRRPGDIPTSGIPAAWNCHDRVLFLHGQSNRNLLDMGPMACVVSSSGPKHGGRPSREPANQRRMGCKWVSRWTKTQMGARGAEAHRPYDEPKAERQKQRQTLELLRMALDKALP